ncbi:MAG: hypothetical protein IKO82_02025 [Prevotella sp.]|nr:hypothetical protein [Prevotella sp.]
MLAIIIVNCQLSIVNCYADAVGTWKLYPSYSTISKAEPTGSKVYALADGNLYSYNIKTTEIREYNATTNPALNGRNITHMVWVKGANKLLIVYSDYLIDLLSSKEEVASIVGLRDASSLKDKTINEIRINGKYAYLITGLGIVKVDAKDNYIEGTYQSAEDVPDMPSSSTAIPTRDGPYGTVYYDQTNNCWWGNDADGKLTKYIEQDGSLVAVSTGVRPDGAVSSYAWRIYKHDGKIFVTGGAFAAGMPSTYTRRPGSVQYYDGSSWTKLEDPGTMTGYDYIAANCIAFDPKDKNHFWVGAGSGLYEYRNYKPVNAYNSKNSALSAVYNTDETRSNVTSMLYDSNGYLWAMNGWCDNFIVRFNSNNESVNFPHSEYNFDNRSTIDIQGTFISPSNGWMFMVNSNWNTNLLYYYNYKNDQLNSVRSFINEDGANIDFGYLYGLTEDDEGNLWITSSKGPFYWAKEDMAKGNATFIQHKINRNDGSGLADYLLAGVSTRCMKLDAAGRKWFATEDGVYLISSDNNTQLLHLTTSNSLLPSNSVYDILIEETGLVWFATAEGICSYQSDVTETYGDLNSDNVYAYPNPVEPGYTGPITIMGLQVGCYITITNTYGYVVNKGTCLGGSYTWNGCDRSGRRVASGVYNVLVATGEGESGCVTKIAVIR